MSFASAGTYGLWSLVAKVVSSALGASVTDDATDRLSRIYTALLLILFSVFVSMKNYVGEPVQCWLQPYKDQREEYVNTVCWISNTYHLPMRHQIPKNIDIREDAQIHYYQWVPLILLCQALLFEIPFHFWRSFSKNSGINMESLIRRIVNEKFLIRTQDEIKKDTDFLGKYVKTSLEFQRDWQSKGNSPGWLKCGLSRTNKSYLFTLYMITKLLYLLNVSLQTLALNKFLETKYFLYGFDLLRDLIKGEEWQDTGRFPRITMCDYDIRILGNLHTHTVQCVLTINLFNEKIYMFLWFWMFFVSIYTFFNGIYWMYVMLSSKSKVKYIKDLLAFIPEETPQIEPDKFLDRSKDNIIDEGFIDKYLGTDGVFLFRIIHQNASALIATKLLRTVLSDYLPRDQSIPRQDGMYPNISNDGSQCSETPTKLMNDEKEPTAPQEETTMRDRDDEFQEA